MKHFLPIKPLVTERQRRDERPTPDSNKPIKTFRRHPTTHDRTTDDIHLCHELYGTPSGEESNKNCQHSSRLTISNRHEAVAVAVAAKQQPRKMMMLVALQAKRLLAEGLTCEVKKHHRTNRAMRRDFLLINAEVMGDR